MTPKSPKCLSFIAYTSKGWNRDEFDPVPVLSIPVQQFALAQVLLNGLAGKADNEKGLEWLEKAVAAGLPEAQSQLAIILQKGKIVKENARRCGFFDRCRYAVSDYRNFVRKASGRDIYDLVLIDPPYAAECCAEAVARLEAAGVLADGAIVVCECGTEPFDPASFAHFDILKSTHYGKKTFVNILLYRKPEEGDGETP